MPLSQQDRRLIQTIDRLKIYLVVMALAVLLYLSLNVEEIRLATSIIGIALCGIFWLTQKLLSLVSKLDYDLTRISNAVRRSLTQEQQKELFGR